MPETEIRIVLTTVGSPEEAAVLARKLRGENLAACVTILPGARSFYFWDGEECDDTETILLIKTSRSVLSKLMKRLPLLHPYDTPEVIVIAPEAVGKRYCRWILNTLSSREKIGSIFLKAEEKQSKKT